MRMCISAGAWSRALLRMCMSAKRMGAWVRSRPLGLWEQKPRVLRLFVCCYKRRRNWNIFDCFQCCTLIASENTNWCPTASENNNGFPTACFCKHIVEIFALAITHHQVSSCLIFSFFHRLPSFSTCFASTHRFHHYAHFVIFVSSLLWSTRLRWQQYEYYK